MGCKKENKIANCIRADGLYVTGMFSPFHPSLPEGAISPRDVMGRVPARPSSSWIRGSTSAPH